MPVDERAYWIWLQQAFPPGSRKPMRLDAAYTGGVQEFHQGGPRLWNTRRDLTDKETAALRDFTLPQAEARLEYAQNMGWQVLAPCGENYPAPLRNIPDPPAVLYCKGELPDLESRLAIAVVGSRKAGADIETVARKFGYQLAAGGACVVSGGAVGVDSAALLGAMSIPASRFISVLPVSLDSTYLARNSKLRKMICEKGGALVTEYFSQQNPEPGTFPVRNRLITGLSRGVVLVQAAQKSGTMIYARHALDQNRDVFVYPGPEDSPLFAGGYALLEDGAKPVTCGEDILAEYAVDPVEQPEQPFVSLFSDLLAPAARKAVRKAETAVLGDSGEALSSQARQVLEALGREPRSVAELEAATGIGAASLLGVLTELEVAGLADSLPGKRYTRRY